MFAFGAIAVGVNAISPIEKNNLMIELSYHTVDNNSNVTANNKEYGIFVLNGKYRFRTAGTDYGNESGVGD